MNFFNKHFKKNSDYEENYNGYYGEDEYQYGENDGTEGYEPDYNDNVVDGTSFEMKIITPKSYSDREDIARCLINGNAVFLNIESLDRASIIRMMDYLSGIVYVLEGKVKWSNSSSVIFAPKNVNISGLEDAEEVAEETEEVEEATEIAEEDYYA
jgi:FtsZ-interacting cell division protein YlmF